ncbi:hypothetical protein ABPG74_016977 [Tetrahymena malaccensis]
MNQKNKAKSKTAYGDFAQIAAQVQMRQSSHIKQIQNSKIQQSVQSDSISFYGNIENSIFASSQIIKQGYLEEGFSLLKKLEYIVIVAEQKRKNVNSSGNQIQDQQSSISDTLHTIESQNLLASIMNNLAFYYHLKQKTNASSLYAQKAVEYDRVYQNLIEQYQNESNQQFILNSTSNKIQYLESIVSQLNTAFKHLQKHFQTSSSTSKEENDMEELILQEKSLLALIQTIKQIKIKKNLFNTTNRLLIAQVLDKQKDDEELQQQQLQHQQQQQNYQSKVFRVSSASSQIEIEGLTLYFLGVLYLQLNKTSMASLYLNQALIIFQSLYLTAPTLYHPFIISIKSFIRNSQPAQIANQRENGVNQNVSEKKSNTYEIFKSNENLENGFEDNYNLSQSYPILFDDKALIDQNIQFQLQQEYKENKYIKLAQHQQAQNEFINKQKNIQYKEDINRKSSQRNSLSHERNDIIQIKNLYSSENAKSNFNNINLKEVFHNQESQPNHPSSSYAITQRRGEFYSPREEDKYKSFKSAIASKLFKSNQQSPAFTPRNSIYTNNSSREGSQTYRLRMGRLKVTQDGFFKKQKNSYFHQKNMLSASDQNESGEIKQQQQFTQQQQQLKQQQQQQQVDIQQPATQQQQIQFPINQQKIQSMIMNHSSQKKMKQFLQNNGIANFLNQHQQGQQKQQLFQSQIYSKTPGQSSNIGNILSSAQKSQHSKHKNQASLQQQPTNITQFTSSQQPQQQQTNNALNSSRTSHKESKQNNVNFPAKQSLLEEIYCSFDSINYLKNKSNKKSTSQSQAQQNILQNNQQINGLKSSQQPQQLQNGVLNMQQNLQQIQQNGTQQIQSHIQPFQQNYLQQQQQAVNKIYQKQQQEYKNNQQHQNNQDQASTSENQINYLRLISGTEPLSRKVSINNNNINMSKSNYIGQQINGNVLNQVNQGLNNFQRNTSIHMMTPNKSTAASLSNNGTSEKSSLQKKLQNSQNVIQFHQIFQQQQFNQITSQDQQQIQPFQQQDQQKKLNANNSSANSYTAQDQNIQQQQQQQQLSRITTQANTTNFTTNNSNHINNNNITSTNNWDSTTQDSLYFQKKIQEINKIENLFHRKDSLPEGNVILQGYSSKNKEQISKRYVIDDTDITNVAGQTDEIFKQNIIKRDAQTARKKSAKQKNSFNNQEQNIYQITLKNICNFPIKVNHSIGKIKSTNTNPLNTRRSSINSQLNENNNKFSQIEQEKLKDIFICQSPISQNKKSQQQKIVSSQNQQNIVTKSHNLQQQPQKNQFQDIDLNIFHQFISNNTQQFQISLAKRINSKLKFLKDRMQSQEEENNAIKQALKMSEELESQLFRKSKNQISAFSHDSNEKQVNPTAAISTSRSNSLNSLSSSFSSIQNN